MLARQNFLHLDLKLLHLTNKLLEIIYVHTQIGVLFEHWPTYVQHKQ